MTRFSHLWDEELAKRGPERASVAIVILRFILVRLFLGGFIMICGVSLNLFSAVSCYLEA